MEVKGQILRGEAFGSDNIEPNDFQFTVQCKPLLGPRLHESAEEFARNDPLDQGLDHFSQTVAGAHLIPVKNGSFFQEKNYAYICTHVEAAAMMKFSRAMTLPEIVGNSFYYFGFGSNMLAKRILIQNKSAVRKGLGKLRDYRLDFYTNTNRWKGAPATIVPTNNSELYGAIWQIDLANLPDLDKQESVGTGMYTPISVPIETAEGVIITCRAYHLTNQPPILPEGVDVPYDRQPSKTYLKVLVKGAIETGAPESYVNWLKGIKHNDNLVDVYERELELESVELFH